MRITPRTVVTLIKQILHNSVLTYLFSFLDNSRHLLLVAAGASLLTRRCGMRGLGAIFAVRLCFQSATRHRYKGCASLEAPVGPYTHHAPFRGDPPSLEVSR
jgi:hypothetical protein